MTKRLFTGLLFSAACLSAMAQQAYMVDKDVAVFYPANYDAAAHSPSPVFVHELVPQGNVPGNWKVKPVYSKEGDKTVVTLNVNADDDLYGTGEVVGDLRRNGKEVNFWNTDNYGYMKEQGKQLYQSHPWVLGVRKDGSAYGIIADNTWKSSLTTNQQIKFVSEGPAFRVIVIERANAKEVMKELAKLSGTMEMPPLWALGFQQCRYSYNPDSRVKEIIDTYRAKNIPCDVVWMDIDYMDQFKVFTYDPKQFPDPQGLQDYAHAKNFKTVYMIDPGVKVEDGYFVYDQGKANDYFVKMPDGTNYTGRVWPGDCNFPDYTRHEVRTWWSGLTSDFVKKGVDGLWNDMNEPAVFDSQTFTMDTEAVHWGDENRDKGSHLRYHNVYGYNMIKASREGMLLAKPNNRPFVLSRDNFLGGHRYGATWTGDNMSTWDHFQMSIPMTLNLSLSGQPFNGPDMGGFGADADAELLAHWTATGIYFPFARNHAAKGTVDQEPWVFGQKVEDVCRTAIERRYRLMPYIYTLFQEATVNGMPVMRPAFMADDKDPALRGEQKVFMLGDDLMIIPRWAKADNIHIPSGDWDVLQLEDKDDMYQAFVAQRPGSIVPMGNVAQSTIELDQNTLTLLVNPAEDGTATGVLYQDAGDGFGYRTGEYAKFQLSAKTEGDNITVSIKQVDGKMDMGQKNIRIGFVTDGKITYSPYVQGNEVTMKTVKDKQMGIDLKKLKFSDIDPSKQPTIQEKLKIQVEKMKKSGQAMEW
ncbi:MAG: DUF5110 domain-containing protein [Bacteroidaceae bacterium]|nr:DUF5110 domain-containing protein [Bacteroidaceae bacterium]